MKNSRFSFPRFPGWIVVLLIFGALYFTGLHTEVLGKIQGAFLSTGIIKPDTEASQNKNSTIATEKDFVLKSLSGETITLKSLSGKTVFLNLWATWCAPCIAEMPNIQKLYEKVNSDDIAFMMLSLDKDPQKVQNFIKKKEYTFPVYVPGGAIPSEFDASVIPTTFVIAPNGDIALKHEGMADYNNKEFIDFLNSLKK